MTRRPRRTHRYTLAGNAEDDNDYEDVLDITREGNKREGYTYLIATFSGEGTFRQQRLQEAQRMAMIEALGGTS